MIIFSWPSDFKIKKKEDALKFMEIGKGVFYWTDEKDDFLMENGHVSSRPVFDRGDVFAPYLGYSTQDAVNIIWRTRKIINNKLRG